MADAALDLNSDTDSRPDLLEEAEEIFEQAEEEEENFTVPQEDTDLQPAFGSPAWNDYVMRKFQEDELVNGAPTCDGCRRVLEDLIGPILDTQITNVIGPTRDNNGTSTICVCIQVKITNESHPAYGEIIRCEDVADVNKENTDSLYGKYPSATASTRAEGRVLRKLLRLRGVYTAEEVSKKALEDDGMEWEPDEPISDSQKDVIDMLCRENRLNLNVMEFINSGKRAYSNINEVTKSTAQRMIQELNKIQRQQKPRPVGVNNYVSDWQTKK